MRPERHAERANLLVHPHRVPLEARTVEDQSRGWEVENGAAASLLRTSLHDISLASLMAVFDPFRPLGK